MPRMAVFVVVLFSALTSFAQNSASTEPQSQTQDASVLEAQYKACAKHYIPKLRNAHRRFTNS